MASSLELLIYVQYRRMQLSNRLPLVPCAYASTYLHLIGNQSSTQSKHRSAQILIQVVALLVFLRLATAK